MRTVLSVILCCLITLSLSAKEKVQTGARPGWLIPIEVDPGKKPLPRDISNGYYFELLDLQTNLLNNTRYTHFIKQFVNESGVQNGSEVSVTFSPEFQQVIFHTIVILRDGMVLNQLQPGQIKIVQEEKDAGDFEYNGLKRAFVTLKDVRKDDRIEVAYSVVGLNPVFAGKFSDEFYFSNATAVCTYIRNILSSKDRPLFIRTFNNAPQPASRVLGNLLVYSWRNPLLLQAVDEANSMTPSWYSKAPSVSVTEYANWQQVVNWGLNTFNRYQYPLPPPLLDKIATWKKITRDDPDAFANLATRFVQNDIRYLGLEIGPNTHRPHSPADVFTHRFGDCKDKSLLLSLILRQAGIPAYVALISTTTRDKLTTAAPSPGEFDHAIVAIERSKGVYLYVDPTLSGQRGELINLYVPAYGYALLLREGETGLQAVEPGFLFSESIVEHLDARYYDTCSFTVRTVYSGGAADKIRQDFQENSEKELEESYRKYYADLFEGIRLDGLLVPEDDSLKNNLTVTENYHIPELWNTRKKGKKSFDFTAKVLTEYLQDPASLPNDEPLALAYPRTINYAAELSMPEIWGWNTAALHIKNASFQFDFTPSINGKDITLTYYFKTFKDHIPADEIVKYKSDYKEIEDRIYFELYKDLSPDNTTPEEPSPSTAPDSPGRAAPSWKACWPAIWLSFFFALLFTRLFVYLNQRSEDTFQTPGFGYPLGGWLILLGLGFGITLLQELVVLYKGDYYSNTTWIAYRAMGGASFQYLHLTGMAIHLSFLAATFATGYWFLHRRDIFPRMFCWYAGILISGRVLLLTLYYNFPHSSWTEYTQLQQVAYFIRTLVYAGIWVRYILRSDQVRGTFLEPFREQAR